MRFAGPEAGAVARARITSESGDVFDGRREREGRANVLESDIQAKEFPCRERCVHARCGMNIETA